MDAVRLLGTYGFLTPVQIAEFVLGETTLTAASREVVTRRILRRLRDRQLVTTNALLAGDPEGMPTRIAYFLTARGRRVVETLDSRSQHRRLRVRGTFLLAHALMVAEIALVFLRQARASSGREVLAWECDWQVALSLGPLPVAPDAKLTYQTPGRRIHAFIEADRGSEGTRFFARKIERYLDLYGDDSRLRLPVWPLILTVAPSEARASELCRATEVALRARPQLSRIARAFRFTSLDALRRGAGPFGETWQVAGRTGRFPLIDEPTTAPGGQVEPGEAASPPCLLSVDRINVR
jgi:hypothetical protein